MDCHFVDTSYFLSVHYRFTTFLALLWCFLRSVPPTIDVPFSFLSAFKEIRSQKRIKDASILMDSPMLLFHHLYLPVAKRKTLRMMSQLEKKSILQTRSAFVSSLICWNLNADDPLALTFRLRSNGLVI